MKQSIKVSSHIDTDIKINDTVVVIDDSSLSYLGTKLPNEEHRWNDDIEVTEDISIIHSYAYLTGSDNKLKEIPARVAQINITDRYSVSPNNSLKTGYLQDCIIQIGKGYFRTASAMTKKI